MTPRCHGTQSLKFQDKDINEKGLPVTKFIKLKPIHKTIVNLKNT